MVSETCEFCLPSRVRCPAEFAGGVPLNAASRLVARVFLSFGLHGTFLPRLRDLEQDLLVLAVELLRHALATAAYCR